MYHPHRLNLTDAPASLPPASASAGRSPAWCVAGSPPHGATPPGVPRPGTDCVPSTPAGHSVCRWVRHRPGSGIGARVLGQRACVEVSSPFSRPLAFRGPEVGLISKEYSRRTGPLSTSSHSGPRSRRSPWGCTTLSFARALSSRFFSRLKANPLVGQWRQLLTAQTGADHRSQTKGRTPFQYQLVMLDTFRRRQLLHRQGDEVGLALPVVQARRRLNLAPVCSNIRAPSRPSPRRKADAHRRLIWVHGAQRLRRRPRLRSSPGPAAQPSCS